MKSFKEVEGTRRAYHADAALNSVHRSSLTVPELPGAAAEISFVNHFLLKRNYPNVACRVTAVDPAGGRIEARLFPVTEPRVYTIPLTGMVEQDVATYLVDFFAAENLFIPFPAVMVNHVGDGFVNSVHAYNRILNDVFEDSAINATAVAEASVDVRIDDDADTFAIFTAGPQPCRGALQVELARDGETHRGELALDVPRLCNRELSLKRLFPGLPSGSGVLKIQQPSQFLFYGRMIAGIRLADGAFAANHSYYDSSVREEYWDDDRPCCRVYPLFDGLTASIRMYPIMSPGRIALTFEAYAADGQAIGSVDAGEVDSPGHGFIDVDVEPALAAAGLNEHASSFAVRAAPVGGNTPTRVNHQLVYRDAGRENALASSVNVSLKNPNIFVPEGKTGLAWGQIPVGGELDSWLGLVVDEPTGEATTIDLAIYGPQGELGQRTVQLSPGGSARLTGADLVSGSSLAPEPEQPTWLWYIARCPRADLSAYVVSRHRRSDHCSGEHNF